MLRRCMEESAVGTRHHSVSQMKDENMLSHPQIQQNKNLYLSLGCFLSVLLSLNVDLVLCSRNQTPL
jgi:hypothetical protein